MSVTKLDETNQFNQEYYEYRETEINWNDIQHKTQFLKFSNHELKLLCLESNDELNFSKLGLFDLNLME